MPNKEKKHIDIVKDVCKYNFYTVESIQKVSKGKPAYKVLYENDNIYRVDILNEGDETTERQKMSHELGCNIFPKIISVINWENYTIKISEWVEGSYFSDLFEQNKLELNMFEKLGEQMAQLNNIANEQGQYLHNDDITMRNMLWDGDKAIVFDMDRLWWEDNPNNSYVKILLKRFVRRNYIDAFLKGYARHRDVSSISQLCASHNWRWKR